MPPTSRLRTALDDGILTLPEGAVHLARPPVGFDVAALRGRDITVSHSFAPDHDAWSHSGVSVTTESQPAATTIVSVPRSKALARDMIARAAAQSDLVIVDGQKTEGVDSLFRAARKRLGDLASIPKAHGRIFWFARTDVLADWAVPPPAASQDGYYTTAGVFSDGQVDKGSAVLAAALPAKLPARMADLGAGWGYLSAQAITRNGIKSLALIEAEALSLDCARRNVTDPRATFHWADATRFKPDTAFDGIVMNPPFHTSRSGDPGLGQAFIAAAARLLAPHGKLWMVANRHLPYEDALSQHFRNVDELPGSPAFKIIHATRPLR